MSDKSVAWIVGAGFSKFLGAPLLRELLTVESAQRIKAAYDGNPDGLSTAGIDDLSAIFESGRDTFNFWADAEEFIEKLDQTKLSASARTVMTDMLRRIVRRIMNDASREPPKTTEIRERAIRAMGIEILQFLRDAQPDLERWTPYRSWVGGLDGTDSVLTFNYDRVPELLKPYAHMKDLEIEIPTIGAYGAAPFVRSSALPHVFKMHGSTDWISHREDVGGATAEALRRDENAPFRVKNIDDLLMATPGPRKEALIMSSFKRIWEGACDALEHARCIVIIGYSMPPTDARTKQWLLDRLRRTAANAGKSIRVHIVLGDSVQGAKDGARLSALIKTVSSYFVVTTWPLRAEDFLGLHERGELFAASANRIPANIHDFTVF